MAWRNVLITQHSKLSYKMNHLVVKTETDVHQIPLDDIQCLIIGTTRAVITSYAVMMLLRHDVKIVFTDDKSSPIGEIDGYYNNHQRNSRLKKQMMWKEDHRQKLWQQVIRNKMKNQQQLLQDLRQDCEQFTELIDGVDEGDTTNREAVAARLYFTRLIDTGFTRRDEEQPVNAMLNYGYSILLSAFSREINALGYLTNFGIHHDSTENQYNLASDLMEPLRPLVDEVVQRHKEEPLSLDIKVELISLLSDPINFNGHEALVASVCTEMVRDSVGYLNDEASLPYWEFEL